MSFQPYMSVKGAKQGQFKGEATQAKRKDNWMPVFSVTMGLKSPRDPATGQPVGRRLHEPVTIVKQWGAASPQGLVACATNETLTEVVLEFTKMNPNGEEYVYQSVKLTDAAVAEVARFTGRPDAAGRAPTPPERAPTDTLELEKWAFTFRKIEIEDTDGKTSFIDDWSDTS
jgi:type VI secretion system secreted protein Hcp